MVGGLAGLNAGEIGVSFATGAVTGGANSWVGGLVGMNLGVPDQGDAVASANERLHHPTRVQSHLPGDRPDQPVLCDRRGDGRRQQLRRRPRRRSIVGHLDQTYATGRVTGGSGSTLGGLVAANSFSGLPAAGGTTGASRLRRFRRARRPIPYWDTQTTGQSTSKGGTGLTTTRDDLRPAVRIRSDGLEPMCRRDLLSRTCRASSRTHSAGQPRAAQIRRQTVDPPQNPDASPQVDPPPPQQNPQIAGTQTLPLQVANLILQVNTQPTTPPQVVDPTTQTTQGGQGGQGNSRGGRSNSGDTTAGIGPTRPDGRPSNIPPLNETRFINNQVVVQIGANVPPDVLDRIVRRLGLSVMSSQTLGLLGTRVIQFQFAGGKNIRDVIRELEKQKIIDEATPNYEFDLARTRPRRPATGNGDPAQYVIEKLQLAEAHRIATGENVRIAVIDSEIDSKHPDLEGRIEARYEEVGPVDKPHPHGTGMAGAIVSHRKLMGTAPGARILAIRAFGGPSGGKGTTMQIVKGLDWAISQNARIVNMSFAGPKDPTLAKAFKAAFDKGVVLIAAAGNAGPKSPPLYPGADPNVIAVSATDADDQIYTNSNRGKYVAVAAPGVDILVPAPDGNYEFTTGTSVAAAHVSGVAALLLQRDPKLDPADGARAAGVDRESARHQRPHRRLRLRPGRPAQGAADGRGQRRRGRPAPVVAAAR